MVVASSIVIELSAWWLMSDDMPLLANELTPSTTLVP
jgi:hypothetical protein